MSWIGEENGNEDRWGWIRRKRRERERTEKRNVHFTLNRREF
jgi:hypothetical protein